MAASKVDRERHSEREKETQRERRRARLTVVMHRHGNWTLVRPGRAVLCGGASVDPAIPGHVISLARQSLPPPKGPFPRPAQLAAADDAKPFGSCSACARRERRNRKKRNIDSVCVCVCVCVRVRVSVRPRFFPPAAAAAATSTIQPTHDESEVAHFSFPSTVPSARAPSPLSSPVSSSLSLFFSRALSCPALPSPSRDTIAKPMRHP